MSLFQVPLLRRPPSTGTAAIHAMPMTHHDLKVPGSTARLTQIWSCPLGKTHVLYLEPCQRSLIPTCYRMMRAERDMIERNPPTHPSPHTPPVPSAERVFFFQRPWHQGIERESFHR